MSGSGFDPKDVAAAKAALRAAASAYPQAAAAALYQEGAGILAQATKNAPVEFAVLRTSGYVAPPTLDKSTDGSVVELGFGTSYAAPVHENMTARHPRGGGPKYLQRAADGAMQGWDARMAKRIADLVGPDGKLKVKVPSRTIGKRLPPEAWDAQRRAKVLAHRAKQRAKDMKKQERKAVARQARKERVAESKRRKKALLQEGHRAARAQLAEERALAQVAGRNAAARRKAALRAEGKAQARVMRSTEKATALVAARNARKRARKGGK